MLVEPTKLAVTVTAILAMVSLLQLAEATSNYSSSSLHTRDSCLMQALLRTSSDCCWVSTRSNLCQGLQDPSHEL